MSPAGARLALLINPSARRSGRGSLASAVRVLETRYRVDVSSPASPAAMAEAARDAVRKEVAAVVVAGGDGSVNCVAGALSRSGVPLGILPVGTGNDFAQAMGVPRMAEAAARRIVEGRVVTVDLVRVNGRLFCTAGVLGVPADAALSVRRWFSPGARSRPLLHLIGSASYSLAAARELVRFRSIAERYAIAAYPDPEAAVRAHGIFFANTPVLGGGLVLPVGSDATDGRMEIVVILEMPRPRLLWAFVCFARGWRIPAGVLRVTRTAHAIVSCETPRRFAADGDLMTEDVRFTLTVEPQSLVVVR